MKNVGQVIREIISVIIGILIALFVNNWNEERKDKEYLNQILSSIEKELIESKTDIERVIPKQKALLDSLDVYMNNENVSLYDIVVKANGIHSPSIKTNSWNAIANSKIELIEYEKLSELADIEERKENLDARIEKQMEFLFQNFENSQRQKKEIAKFMISDIIGAEIRFKSTIEEILKN